MAETTKEQRKELRRPETALEELMILQEHRNFLSIHGGPAPGRAFEPSLLHRLIRDAQRLHADVDRVEQLEQENNRLSLAMRDVIETAYIFQCQPVIDSVLAGLAGAKP